MPDIYTIFTRPISGTLGVSGSIYLPNTQRLFGTASQAITASAATSITFTPTTASFATTASAATSITFTPTTASFATTASAATSITFTPSTASFSTTASFATSASFAPTFPYTGVARISGSLLVTGSTIISSSTIGLGFIPDPENYLLGTGTQMAYGNNNGNATLSIVTPGNAVGTLYFAKFNPSTGLDKSAAGLQYNHGTGTMGVFAASDVRLYLNNSALYPNGTIDLGLTNARFANMYATSFVGTASLASTASFTTSASFTTTASAATSITFTPTSASFATTSSAATSITFTPSTASFATTSSYVLPLGLPTGTVSASGQVDVRNTTGITTIATTGSNVFIGNQRITGSLILSSSAPTELQIVGNTEMTGSLSFISGGVTGSIFGTSSWANNVITASFATTSSAATSITFVPTSASFATTASAATSITFTPTSASFATTSSAATSITFTPTTASFATTSSFATTASFAPYGGLRTKVGNVANTSFAGNPKKATVTFTTAFPNTSYAVVITGEDLRSWTIESKAVGSFVINANSNTGLTGTTYWVASAYGEA